MLPVDAYMCQKSNLAFIMIMACRLIGAEPFFLINANWWFGIFWYQNLCQFMVGMLSVCYRFGVWDCRSAVGYDSSIVLMVGFHSVSCRLSIGLKLGDSIPILTRSEPDMTPTGFAMSSATLSVANRWPIDWKFCVFLSVSCQFGRCDWGIKEDSLVID